MTPKEALRKIKEVCPTATRLLCIKQNVDPNTFYIGLGSNIEWGDTTEYTEPQYRELVLADLEQHRASIEVQHDLEPSQWFEAKLLGVIKYQEEYQWFFEDQRGIQGPVLHSQCRIAVK